MQTLILIGGLTAAALGAYAALIEPGIRLVVRRHAFASPSWPRGHDTLSIAVLSDLHICEPWTGLARIRRIVRRTNALKPDIVLLLGDYEPCYRYAPARRIEPDRWVGVLAGLQARLGVFTILGNHDWWDAPDELRAAFARTHITLLENDAVRVESPGGAFWVAGTASMDASAEGGFGHDRRDDLPATFTRITDDSPVILMVHEPDQFDEIDRDVALTLSGHTHGGRSGCPSSAGPPCRSATARDAGTARSAGAGGTCWYRAGWAPPSCRFASACPRKSIM